MALVRRVYRGKAVSCRLMPAFLGARSEEFRDFVKKQRAKFPDFVPCPKASGWVRIRTSCDYCEHAKIEKATANE